MTQREKKVQAKTKFIAGIMSYIASEHLIAETGAMARQLCKSYFPNADEIMINEFEIYAINLQKHYYDNLSIDELIGKYKETPTLKRSKRG